MRHLLAIALLIVGCAGAAAQTSTPALPAGSDAMSDAAWAPPSYGLATAGGAGATALQSLGKGTGTTGTVVTKDAPLPVVPEPPKRTAEWKWAAQQVCITTCRNGWCDANQWQTCEGTACPYPGRGCYAPWNAAVAQSTGGFSVAPGTPADANNCVSMIFQPNPYYCYVGH